MSILKLLLLLLLFLTLNIENFKAIQMTSFHKIDTHYIYWSLRFLFCDFVMHTNFLKSKYSNKAIQEDKLHSQNK